MQDVDSIKQRIEYVDLKYAENRPKDLVCPICGLIADEQELELMKVGRGHHTNGKQHQGYLLIRSTMKELEEQSARDKKEGLRSPSPSPVKILPRIEAKPVNANRTRSPR